MSIPPVGTIWGLIDQLLSGDSVLQQLSASVYYGRVPPHTPMPFITFFSPSGGTNLWVAPAKKGAPYIEQPRLQVSCYSNFEQTTATMAIRVGALLDWDTENLGSRFSVMALMRTSSLDNIVIEEKYGDSANDVWHTPVFYEIMSQKTL